MKHENAYRSLIVAELKPLLAFPVENAASVGAPDICCVAGWIELKLAGRRVASFTGVVSVDVRPAQRLWMRSWRAAGGPGWYLTYVMKTWMLHDGAWGAENLGRVSHAALVTNATLLSNRAVPSFQMMFQAMQIDRPCQFTEK